MMGDLLRTMWFRTAPVLLVLVWLTVPSDTSWSQADSSPADQPAGPQWEGPLLMGPVSKLFAFAGGTLLAQRPNDLQVSTDGGQTWEGVPLPPAGPPLNEFTPRSRAFGLLGADPGDARVLFATGAAPLYKSTDGGTTWRVVLTAGQLEDLKRDSSASQEPATEGIGFHTLAVAVSPADRTRVYAEVAWLGHYAPYGLLESSDGGETWTLQQKVAYSTLCNVTVLILMAHPTNPRRLFRATDCLAGRNFGSSLAQSSDEAQTFGPFWEVSDGPGRVVSICRGTESTHGYPRRLVGGTGAAPSRWYLAVNRDFRFGGSTVLRSDDDGATWQDVLAYRGGGLPDCTEPGDWNVQLAGLAYDPEDPDRLYVARIAYDPRADFSQPAESVYPVVASGITMTRDAGTTWTDLAGQQLGRLTDLALGSDHDALYAATDQGAWRLDLSQVP
jgi:photosystem II stability/assembly factor-like uncharacterized protein